MTTATGADLPFAIECAVFALSHAGVLLAIRMLRGMRAATPEAALTF